MVREGRLKLGELKGAAAAAPFYIIQVKLVLYVVLSQILLQGVDD